MTTVEEILAAKPPGLRKSALAAYDEHLRSTAAEREAAIRELMAEAAIWLRDTLGVPEAQIADIEFIGKPYQSPQGPSVTWVLDGVGFRARTDRKKLIDGDAGSKEFARETVWEEFTVYEVTEYDPQTAATWQKIDSLVSLGRWLGSSKLGKGVE